MKKTLLFITISSLVVAQCSAVVAASPAEVLIKASEKQRSIGQITTRQQRYEARAILTRISDFNEQFVLLTPTKSEHFEATQLLFMAQGLKTIQEQLKHLLNNATIAHTPSNSDEALLMTKKFGKMRSVVAKAETALANFTKKYNENSPNLPVTAVPIIVTPLPGPRDEHTVRIPRNPNSPDGRYTDWV